MGMIYDDVEDHEAHTLGRQRSAPGTSLSGPLECTRPTDDDNDDSSTGKPRVVRAPSTVDQRLTVSVEEAGRLLGISRGHAYALVNRGAIPSLRLGRRIVVPLRAIDRLLDRPDDAA